MSLARHLDPSGTEYVTVCRPLESLTDEQLVALHKAGDCIPVVAFTVVILPKESIIR